MTAITIAIWVDSNGDVRAEVDDCEAYNNLDDTLAIRKVVLNVEIPAPEEVTEVDVEVPEEKPAGEPTVKVGTSPASDWQPEILEPVRASPEPATKSSRWFGR